MAAAGTLLLLIVLLLLRVNDGFNSHLHRLVPAAGIHSTGTHSALLRATPGITNINPQSGPITSNVIDANAASNNTRYYGIGRIGTIAMQAAYSTLNRNGITRPAASVTSSLQSFYGPSSRGPAAEPNSATAAAAAASPAPTQYVMAPANEAEPAEGGGVGGLGAGTAEGGGLFGLARRGAGDLVRGTWSGITSVFFRGNGASDPSPPAAPGGARTPPLVEAGVDSTGRTLYTYEPKGVLSKTKLFLRRRLLNIFNRSPKGWTQAVEGSTMKALSTKRNSANANANAVRPRLLGSGSKTGTDAATEPPPPDQPSWTERLVGWAPLINERPSTQVQVQGEEYRMRLRRRELDATERRVFRDGGRRMGQREATELGKERGPIGAVLAFLGGQFRTPVAPSARSATATRRESYIDTLSRAPAPGPPLARIRKALGGGLESALGPAGQAAGSVGRAVGWVGGVALNLSGDAVIKVGRVFIPPPPAEAQGAGAVELEVAAPAARIEPPPPPAPPAPPVPAPATDPHTPLDMQEEGRGWFGLPFPKLSLPGFSATQETATNPAPDAKQIEPALWPWDRFYRGDMPFFDNGATNAKAIANGQASLDAGRTSSSSLDNMEGAARAAGAESRASSNGLVTMEEARAWRPAPNPDPNPTPTLPWRQAPMEAAPQEPFRWPSLPSLPFTRPADAPQPAPAAQQVCLFRVNFSI